jgi:hypothetical protein
MALAFVGLSPVLVSRAEPSAGLALLGPDYPRAFFFRASETGPSRKNVTYEKWEGEFGRLMGLMGKCLDEELTGREALNPEWFSRFKRDNPTQAVLLHFNGNARDPRYGAQKYYSGHWVYREATTIVADVPAEPGESVLSVSSASDFRTESGRYHTSNDDLALFGVASDGKHDWLRCEQVQLVAVNLKAGTIRVRRGCYGTKPLAFKAGQAKAAAHAVEGPWGKASHLLWFYNFATHCPKDAEGKSCADRLVEDLVGWLGSGGKLAAFDGLEFDVMHNDTRGDTDGDGIADDGVAGGINQYGIGMVAFAQRLRDRLGPDRIIQGDGAMGPGGVHSQRAFGILNGIESEGWPNLNDWAFDDWSGGLNRHAFWRANAFPPAFSYINHKWVEPVEGKPGEQQEAQVPFARHRLAFAAAQFTDSMICYAFQPPRDAKGRIGIWDEFVCGTKGRLGWLGKPTGPVVRLAAAKPDALGARTSDALARRIAGAVTAQASEQGVVVAAADPSAAELVFLIRDVPVTGEELTVFATLQGEPRKGYPAAMARYAEIEVSGGAALLLERKPQVTGMALRGRAEAPVDESTGARILFQTNVKIGGLSLPAYSIHPPFKAVKGSVFWCRDVEVPKDAELRFSLGMSDKAPLRSDGVWYSVLVAELAGNTAGAYEKAFEESTKAHAWLPRSVPLSKWAGKRVRFKFVADCGPNDNATADQGFWGDVKLACAGVSEAELTPPFSLMTWVNGKPFDASFYFRNIRSKQVSLTFRIEGSEPVTLRALAAHASPDAQCRLFEHGMVLANPGRAPFTFNLASLAPGRTLRRIQGTPQQDLKANSGEPAGASLTLGPLEGLFLVEE